MCQFTLGIMGLTGLDTYSPDQLAAVRTYSEEG
jgi:hypothetical protein